MKNNWVNKLICFFFGHKLIEYRYYNEYNICMNRKGGKRKGAGVKKYKVKHKKYYCDRCDKFFNKKPKQ